MRLIEEVWKVFRPPINYDELLKKLPYKYAIPMAVARRAEALNDFARPTVKTEDDNLVSIALKELQIGKIVIKNEEMLRVLIPDVK
ncbi:MAG: DNA-directed RNA polymerase subunit omega [Thermotogae bacterium]|nr:MAG: DNA-directed RNA polymerase subunit omega [Thermotogota bacterium]